VGLGELCAEICCIIRRYAPAGQPLWPAFASSAYAALLQGEERGVFCALTWDASPLGTWWDLEGLSPVLGRQLFIGTWSVGWPMSDQAHREALGGALVFEAFVQAANIRGRICIMRNGASAAIAAFHKGSSQSPEMQRWYLSRVAAANDVDFIPWHVPGLSLVA
jgi:hypothetical protein